jgi:hypothetical protein
MTQQQKTFKTRAIASLRRSVKHNGRAKTRALAEMWNPENPNLQAVWEEAKLEVLK